MDDSMDYCIPRTKEEFEAYCAAVDEANDAVVENAIKREQAEKQETE